MEKKVRLIPSCRYIGNGCLERERESNERDIVGARERRKGTVAFNLRGALFF
jgi:hypothetical protein